MAASKRKSPDKRSVKKKKGPSTVAVMLHSVGAQIARHPRLLGGVAGFSVVFSFVAANALWYQPKHHPAPLLATRAFEADGVTPVKVSKAGADDSDPGVTTFRIERQSEDNAADAARPATPSASPLVRDIQTALAGRGLYDGPADGLTGPRTTSAIVFFQETEGLEMTGEPSKELLARIRNIDQAVAVIPDERPSMDQTASTARRADDVAELIRASAQDVPTPMKAQKDAPVELVMKIQKALSGLAYANVKVDGVAGAATRTAIRNFEKSYRLPVTGEPSERVLKKLQSIGAI
ncbi:peptidoglycan-binding protein [Rhizobium sp. KVB221]|uniref:Peptidoglycan-binding protein n=1 Tax=Rhizobium setariae TaxID=2801340 RepID=A0A936YIZ2_9HYPH|nr:peptidoglycan-binding domain-containing protein [Rhizobium setariae]MBL0371008.1 peptidoglycan-binding protein [Rhizobium setariae]